MKYIFILSERKEKVNKMTKFRLSFVQPYKTVLSVLCKLTEKGTLCSRECPLCGIALCIALKLTELPCPANSLPVHRSACEPVPWCRGRER